MKITSQKCKFCGIDNREKILFCRRCKQCQNCGKINIAVNNLICHYCGNGKEE